jgi:hypothetical protein
MDEEFLGGEVDFNDPYALFRLFLTDELLDLIVKETNRYAESKLNSDSNMSTNSSSRKHQLA